jgi:hypothetical protein
MGGFVKLILPIIAVLFALKILGEEGVGGMGRNGGRRRNYQSLWKKCGY